MNADFDSLSPLCADERFEWLRACRVRTGAAVLLKRPRGGAAERAALQREAAVGAALSSAPTLLPRCVASDAGCLLVMEDPGGSLLSARDGRPAPDAVLAIAMRLAQTLAELHGRGLLHNGIRPDAVLCSGAHSWLIDFGDVRSAAAPAAPVAMPERLVYVSPEQAGRTGRAPDARSDLYALGIVLYELLTGAPPFRSADALEQIHWHLAGVARAPAQVDPAIPPVLSALVMKLLARAPEERYQSAAGLLHDLGECARALAAHGHFEALALGRRDVGALVVTDPADAGAHAGGLDGLDLLSVLKAAQAIAGEVELERLLPRLLHIAIENAGADGGALVLESDTGPQVHGAGAAVALAASDEVPAGIVHHVRRTSQSVVLAQADGDAEHGADPYVVRHRPRSVACVAVQTQGRAIGVLYVENRRVAAVFTPQRLRTLHILATQAAISLENARLVAGLRQQVAEGRQAEARLAAALAEVGTLKDGLEAENSYLRRDLIANVSHDLRTPLVSMRGYLDLLLEKGDALSADERRQYLGIAARQSERLGHLVDELFELAKLDFKGMRLARERFPFGELAVDVVQKFQLAAGAKRIRLRVEAPPLLPLVDADIGLMERVLENLIGNALRHTDAGGEVSVTLCAEGAHLVAQVADTGSGIPAPDLPYIFDRFYRGANARGRPHGAGLGLAISKRIMELHDGEIRVDSSAGAGTRFTLRLALVPT